MNFKSGRTLFDWRVCYGVGLMLLGSTAHAADGRWSSAGPYGGRVDSAVLGTNEPGVVYASAHRSVYRSEDGGLNWTLAAAGLSTVTSGESVIVAHPTLTGHLALAGARGVFLTQDGREPHHGGARLRGK